MTNFLKHCFVVSCLFVQVRASLSAIGSSEVPLCPMSGWVCRWKPFWIPVEDSFKKAFVEECVFLSEEPSEGPSSAEDPMVHNTDHREFIPVIPTASKHSTSFFGSELRHHCLRCGHGQNVTSFIHVSSVPFLSV